MDLQRANHNNNTQTTFWQKAFFATCLTSGAALALGYSLGHINEYDALYYTKYSSLFAGALLNNISNKTPSQIDNSRITKPGVQFSTFDLINMATIFGTAVCGLPENPIASNIIFGLSGALLSSVGQKMYGCFAKKEDLFSDAELKSLREDSLEKNLTQFEHLLSARNYDKSAKFAEIVLENSPKYGKSNRIEYLAYVVIKHFEKFSDSASELAPVVDILMANDNYELNNVWMGVDPSLFKVVLQSYITSLKNKELLAGEKELTIEQIQKYLKGQLIGLVSFNQFPLTNAKILIAELTDFDPRKPLRPGGETCLESAECYGHNQEVIKYLKSLLPAPELPAPELPAPELPAPEVRACKVRPPLLLEKVNFLKVDKFNTEDIKNFANCHLGLRHTSSQEDQDREVIEGIPNGCSLNISPKESQLKVMGNRSWTEISPHEQDTFVQHFEQGIRNFIINESLAYDLKNKIVLKETKVRDVVAVVNSCRFAIIDYGTDEYGTPSSSYPRDHGSWGYGLGRYPKCSVTADKIFPLVPIKIEDLGYSEQELDQTLSSREQSEELLDRMKTCYMNTLIQTIRPHLRNRTQFEFS